LFKTIGNAFLSGYRQAYAVANYSLQHYYSADTFNENTPPSSDPGFLKNYSTATYNAMAVADGDSVWVTQAWAFGASYWTNDRLEAYLSGVSNSSMLMLDLVYDQMPLWDGQVR
jgi:alpha-N-acetylglucosaminidase